jgi:hypothetical protein
MIPARSPFLIHSYRCVCPVRFSKESAKQSNYAVYLRLTLAMFFNVKLSFPLMFVHSPQAHDILFTVLVFVTKRVLIRAESCHAVKVYHTLLCLGCPAYARSATFPKW